MAQTKLATRLTAMEDAQELGQVGARVDPYHDCAVPDCTVKHVFAHEVTVCHKCRKETCYPHRFTDRHSCIKTSTPITDPTKSPSPQPPRPTERPCTKPSCRVTIDPSKRKGDVCPRCRQVFCWTHQKEFMHECKPRVSNLIGGKSSGKTTANPMEAFRSMFRAKNEARSAAKSGGVAIPIKTTSSIPASVTNRISAFRSKAPATSAAPTTGKPETIKGSQLPREKRCLVYLQAETTTTTKTLPPETRVYLDSTVSIGRNLDTALSYLGLEDNNNKDPDPEHWWGFFNLDAGNGREPIPVSSLDRLGTFAREGEHLVLMRGVMAFRQNSTSP